SDWRDHRPSEETFHKATRLIRAIVDSPEGGHLHVSADKLIENCDRIAHASGGIFGIHRVSPEEKAAIAEIAAAVRNRGPLVCSFRDAAFSDDSHPDDWGNPLHACAARARAGQGAGTSGAGRGAKRMMRVVVLSRQVGIPGRIRSTLPQKSLSGPERGDEGGADQRGPNLRA